MPETATLFDLSQDLFRVKEMIDETISRLAHLNEFPVEDDDHVATMDAERKRLESVLTLLMDDELQAEYEASDKLDGYGHVMSELDAEADALLARADVLLNRARAIKDRAETKKNAVKRMKARVLHFLQFHDITSITGDDFRFRRQKNGGRTPVEMADVDPEDLPEAFQRVKVYPDKSAIYAALKDGQELPFARLGERSEHLRVE